MKNDFESILENLKKETSYFSELDDIKEGNNTLEAKETKKVDSFLTQRDKYKIENDKNVSSKFNVVWSENKETLLFFLIVSLIVILVGILSSIDYVIFAGIFSFLLASVIIFITFYRYVISASAKTVYPSNILDRIERLETKMNYLMKELNDFKGETSYDLVSEINEIKAVLKSIVEVNKKR